MFPIRFSQNQLKTDREKWDKQVERHQRLMDKEKAELEELKAKVQRDRDEMEKDRVETARLKEETQRKLFELRKDKTHSSSNSTSSLHLSNRNANNSTSTDPLLLTKDSKHTTVSHSKSSSNISNIHPATVDSASWKSKPSLATTPATPATYAQGDYPQTFPGTKRGDPHAVASNTQLPVHLKYSATNQLATGQVSRPFFRQCTLHNTDTDPYLKENSSFVSRAIKSRT